MVRYAVALRTLRDDLGFVDYGLFYLSVFGALRCRASHPTG
ncbi:hypothetical protein PN462_03655 [Spirulina sp. CS-785/01]|nr:hypothetical protein [Spirulina sp. CS-785/01]MDB9312186.1 hypothetical protein [Spirulina sp. CS-785/01]